MLLDPFPHPAQSHSIISFTSLISLHNLLDKRHIQIYLNLNYLQGVTIENQNPAEPIVIWVSILLRGFAGLYDCL
jgi:hypothetical protein